MKLVFDTNVIIAAFIAHGTSAELLEHALVAHDVILGDFILGELREKLRHKFGFALARTSEVDAFLRGHSRLVRAIPLGQQVCRDADDDNILAIAQTAGADAIITGDRDLLDLREFKGIRILAPADFWRFERKPPD